VPGNRAPYPYARRPCPSSHESIQRITAGNPFLFPGFPSWYFLRRIRRCPELLFVPLTSARVSHTILCRPKSRTRRGEQVTHLFSYSYGCRVSYEGGLMGSTEEASCWRGTQPANVGLVGRLAPRLLFLQQLRPSNPRGPRRRELSPRLIGGRRAVRQISPCMHAFPFPTRITRGTALAEV